MMKRILFIVLGLLLSLAAVAQFSAASFGASGTYNDKTKADSGLAKIYVFKSLVGATVSYTTLKTNTVTIYSYEDSYTEGKKPVEKSNIDTTSIGVNQKKYTVKNLQDSRGLVMDDNGQPKAVWIVDYSQHMPKLIGLQTEESEDDKCKSLKLVIDKSDVLQYRGTAGQLKEIVRTYDISYDVFTWNKEEFVSEVYTEENVPIVGTEVVLTEKVPNRNTKFTVSGDQFGKDFGMAHLSSVTSTMYEAASVEAYITYEQEKREADNEIGEKPALGGSAPVDIDFFGHANEPVANHFSWFIFNKKDMKNPIVRFADKDMSYTFEQYGDYVVRFEATNTRSQCMDSVSVGINISDSELDVPNYFSPRGTPGSNDVFKVAYRSLVKFKCTIFNRWGNKVYEWTDPAQGWDGRYKGTLVNPGVYYYVIEAMGADGKKYKRGGDINIL